MVRVLSCAHCDRVLAIGGAGLHDAGMSHEDADGTVHAGTVAFEDPKRDHGGAIDGWFAAHPDATGARLVAALGLTPDAPPPPPPTDRPAPSPSIDDVVEKVVAKVLRGLGLAPKQAAE